MVKLRVNGQERSFDGDPSMPLLWYLRDERQYLPLRLLSAHHRRHQGGRHRSVT